MPVVNDKIWQSLFSHQQSMVRERMTAMFEADPGRAARYRIDAAGLRLDYSKNLVNDDSLNLFSRLIDANSLPQRVQQLFDGERINTSENRQALHTLLRARSARDIPARLTTEAEAVSRVLSRMESIATDIRNGRWLGHNGKPIRQIIHIGIGGSYLGPKMAAEALTPYQAGGIECHYVANVDGHHIDHLLTRLDQDETLVIVVSKTFTTLETMLNAATARHWLLQKVPENELHKHQVAVTANVSAAVASGVAEDNVLPIWDWVGGRYSLWSAVGLPIAITHGFRTFRGLLDGAAAMDEHFRDAPWPDNMPMMLALLGIWYRNFFGVGTHAVLPYDHWLRLLPAHLQQLDMESNGKSVSSRGQPLNYPTGPIIWGSEESNGQHAFHQWLHQAGDFAGVDFILPLTPHHDRVEHHNWLVANCLAQSRALMVGRALTEIPAGGEVAPQRVMPGNRPSNTILMDKLTPQTLGALIALYEHKVFCQAMIWHINPFDQWGVELGKELGKSIYETITGQDEADAMDASTKGLIDYYKSKLKS